MTALVGPLQPVVYNNRVDYRDLPRNTLDIRYEACGNHHLACDCREALLAESEGEWRHMYNALETAILDAIKSHNTWDEIEANRCQCQACAIARSCHVGFFAWYDTHISVDQRFAEDVPF